MTIVPVYTSGKNMSSFNEFLCREGNIPGWRTACCPAAVVTIRGASIPLHNYVWVTSRTILYVKYLYLTF